MIVIGQIQGKIKGPVTLAGRQDSFRVHGCSYEVVSPRDPGSGLPTGKRMHKPVTVVKDIDGASPLFMRALITNENINEVVLQFCHKDGAGRDMPYYTIRLLNAGLSGIRMLRKSDILPGAASWPSEREELSFTYQQITWKWEQGGNKSNRRLESASRVSFQAL